MQMMHSLQVLRNVKEYDSFHKISVLKLQMDKQFLTGLRLISVFTNVIKCVIYYYS